MGDQWLILLMDFQTAIANYSREFPGHLKVSRVNFVGELDFTEGLGRSKVQGRRECFWKLGSDRTSIGTPTANGQQDR